MRQTRIDYTLVAEGHAEYAFIPAYLRLIAAKFNIQVVLSKLGFKGQKAGKAKVLKEASAIFSTAIGQGHQLLIVGIDLDKPDYEQEQPGHTAECRLLLNAQKIRRSNSAFRNCPSHRTMVSIPKLSDKYWQEVSA